MVWRFQVYISGLTEFSDEQVDRLYEAGCSDGTLASGNLRAWIGFSREASTLQIAIASAIADIRSTGLQADRVEIDELEPAELSHWSEAV